MRPLALAIGQALFFLQKRNTCCPQRDFALDSHMPNVVIYFSRLALGSGAKAVLRSIDPLKAP